MDDFLFDGRRDRCKHRGYRIKVVPKVLERFNLDYDICDLFKVRPSTTIIDKRLDPYRTLIHMLVVSKISRLYLNSSKNRENK